MNQSVLEEAQRSLMTELVAAKLWRATGWANHDDSVAGARPDTCDEIAQYHVVARPIGAGHGRGQVTTSHAECAEAVGKDLVDFDFVPTMSSRCGQISTRNTTPAKMITNRPFYLGDNFLSKVKMSGTGLIPCGAFFSKVKNTGKWLLRGL